MLNPANVNFPPDSEMAHASRATYNELLHLIQALQGWQAGFGESNRMEVEVRANEPGVLRIRGWFGEVPTFFLTLQNSGTGDSSAQEANEESPDPENIV